MQGIAAPWWVLSSVTSYSGDGGAKFAFYNFEKGCQEKRSPRQHFFTTDKSSPESPGVDCASFFTQRCAPQFDADRVLRPRSPSDQDGPLSVL